MKILRIILSAFFIFLLSNSYAVDSYTENDTKSNSEGCVKTQIEKKDISDKKTFKKFKKQKIKLKRSQRKQLRKLLKNDPDPEFDEALLVLLAIILPPLAVYMVEGIGDLFWIDLILTILGWIPGMIFALYIVLR